MKLNYTKNNKGLTLIEALIWFAIFAAVVAGVFALYHNSRDSNNASTANKELSTIFAQTENAFASDSTASLTNLVGLQLGIFPNSVKVTDSTKGTISNVFGGTITILGVAPSGFTVTYTKVPRGNTCSAIVRAQKAVGWDYVNDSNYKTDYSMAGLGNFCGLEGNGSTDLVFKRNNSQ